MEILRKIKGHHITNFTMSLIEIKSVFIGLTTMKQRSYVMKRFLREMASFLRWSGAIPKSSMQGMLLCRVFETSPTATATSETAHIALDGRTGVTGKTTSGGKGGRRKFPREDDERRGGGRGGGEARSTVHTLEEAAALQRLFVGGSETSEGDGRTKTQNGNLQRHLSLPPSSPSRGNL